MKTSQLVALALLLGAVSTLPAAEVVLRPVADAHVRNSVAHFIMNFGQSQTLEANRGVGTNHDREIYLKFDLTGVTSVRTAKLRLWGSGPSGAVVTTDVYSAPDVSWTENGIRSNNRPPVGPVMWDSAALQDQPGWHEWDISQYLMGEKTMGRDVVTLVLRNSAATTGPAVFNSDENSVNPPQLVIEESFPWTYYEAERGVASPGAVLETGTSWGQTAFEARGKQVVTLDAAGEYVEWTNLRPASHAIVRYSLPDGAMGTLALYTSADGGASWNKQGDFALSSAGMRETKTGAIPPDGVVRYFEEAMLAVPGGIPAGAKVRVQKDLADGTAYIIDYLDLEQHPAAGTKPDDTWVSVVQGTGDDRAAIVAAIAAANAGSKKVWLPAGTYTINLAGGPANGGIAVPAGISIRGAGMWHTTLIENYGGDNRRLFSMAGRNTMQDFKVVSNITSLTGNPSYVAFRPGDNSSGHLVERIWAEKVTLWLGLSVSNSTVRDCRVRNTYKDSIHFANNSSNNLIEKNCIRNSGDDNVALVPYENLTMVNNVVQYNVAEFGWWGRGYTNIGGRGNIIRNNLANDCARAGIAVMIEIFNNRQTQFCLDWVVERNVVIRCGSQVNNPVTSAIVIYAAQDFPMSGRMDRNLILAPPFHGARLTGFIGDPNTANVVSFRYNAIEAPVAGGTFVRKNTSQLNANNNLVHTPNTDL